MKLSFARKLWIPLILSLLCLAVVSTSDAYRTRAISFDARKQDLVHATELAISVVRTYADQAAKGQITVDDARKRAADALRAMRYGADGSGYFSIVSSKGVVIMHPFRPDFEGKSANDSSAQGGIELYRLVVNQVEHGGPGFVRFSFAKPGSNKVVPKVLYCDTYPAWDWIFTTGLYVDDIDAEFHATLYRSLGIFALVAVMLSVVVVLLNRGTLRTLGGEPAYAAEISSRIATNDLTEAVKTAPGDKDSLLCSIRRMQEQLSSTIARIKTSSESIALATSEIAAGNQDLSRRTEAQAASLGETAASLEQLTATVNHNADNARQASQVASQAVEIAQRGRDVVSKVIDTMTGIHGSSDKISSIVDLIDSIAFQTNILALNAAVEAARAGEQGRGFAVVAAEVRSLAQRSASASKEIKDLINDSVERVKAGSEFVKASGETMTEVVRSVGRVTDIMGEVAAASVEQSKGIGQVNAAVSEMDSMTQQNAALVEQAAAAAASLESQTDELRSTVSTFKLP
ncbi:methyl-accepting chemotaxis protein [Paraburkholderia sp. Cpub6]|uniref:methyl-accepting chemotaxis protein n=1 Tax=Paraburkholderia sp. Cpub6 TaxID=2723094 RepID=UPI0016182CFC|nr:methyl-accepting chemotaxis protein [Paraburkholderia sp. Cpub6]MBB5460234.1 methyl-accepting chemotaxis protein [Paraburkholderia sp. Cpub6]